MKLLPVTVLLESTEQITDWNLDEPAIITTAVLAEQLQVIHNALSYFPHF